MSMKLTNPPPPFPPLIAAVATTAANMRLCYTMNGVAGTWVAQAAPSLQVIQAVASSVTSVNPSVVGAGTLAELSFGGAVPSVSSRLGFGTGGGCAAPVSVFDYDEAGRLDGWRGGSLLSVVSISIAHVCDHRGHPCFPTSLNSRGERPDSDPGRSERGDRHLVLLDRRRGLVCGPGSRAACRPGRVPGLGDRHCARHYRRRRSWRPSRGHVGPGVFVCVCVRAR